MNTNRRIEQYCKQYLTVPTPEIVEFVQCLLEMLDECSWISADLEEPAAIVFITDKPDKVRYETSQSRTLLRLICARLVGIATEAGCADLNPYEGGYNIMSVDHKGNRIHIRVDYVNTSSQQRFRLGIM